MTKTEQILAPLLHTALAVIIYFIFEELGLSPTPKLMVILMIVGIAAHLFYANEKGFLDCPAPALSMRAMNFMVCLGFSSAFVILSSALLASVLFFLERKLMNGAISLSAPLLALFMVYRVKLA